MLVVGMYFVFVLVASSLESMNTHWSPGSTSLRRVFLEDGEEGRGASERPELGTK